MKETITLTLFDRIYEIEGTPYSIVLHNGKFFVTTNNFVSKERFDTYEECRDYFSLKNKHELNENTTP